MNHRHLFITVITVVIVSILFLRSEHANATLGLNEKVRLPTGVTAQDLDPTINVIAYNAQMEIVDTFSMSIKQSNGQAVSAATVYSSGNIHQSAKEQKYLLLIGCTKYDYLADNESHFTSDNFDYLFTKSNSLAALTSLANFLENFTVAFQGTFLEDLARYTYLLSAMFVFFIKDFI